jgi:phosphoribosylformimino-5-aminoimidazole carboxamide ribonucleotide (ProFAR) isomerase
MERYTKTKSQLPPGIPEVALLIVFMEKHTVTVYIEGRSYQIAITVNKMNHETIYEVITSGNILKDFSPDAEEVIPEYISWQEDSAVRPEERIKMVESEQIARIIWTDILDMMES